MLFAHPESLKNAFSRSVKGYEKMDLTVHALIILQTGLN